MGGEGKRTAVTGHVCTAGGRGQARRARSPLLGEVSPGEGPRWPWHQPAAKALPGPGKALSRGRAPACGVF